MSDTPELPAEVIDDAPSTPPGPIVARAGGEYRLKRLLLVVLMGGYGLWSCYDGFVKMPQYNADAARHHQKPLPEYDIPFNRTLGVALPPLALALLAYSLHASRGAIRLDADTLTAPGHPPVPLSAVTAVDRGQWDRKGIARVSYQLPDGVAGQVTLDDFVYQRQPIDQIFDRVLAAVEAPAATPEAPSTIEPPPA